MNADELKQQFAGALEGAGDEALKTMAAAVLAAIEVSAQRGRAKAEASAEKGGPCWKVPPFVCPVRESINATVTTGGRQLVLPIGWMEGDPVSGDVRVTIGTASAEHTGKRGQAFESIAFDAMRLALEELARGCAEQEAARDRRIVLGDPGNVVADAAAIPDRDEREQFLKDFADTLKPSAEEVDQASASLEEKLRKVSNMAIHAESKAEDLFRALEERVNLLEAMIMNLVEGGDDDEDADEESGQQILF